jgi:cytochrome P450
LLDNSILPKEDKSVSRLWEEAQLLIAAGTVTTAASISSAFVYLLLDPKRLQVLLEELEMAIPIPSKPPRQAELEQLPYIVSYSDKCSNGNYANNLLECCCSRDPSSDVRRLLSSRMFRSN